MFVLVFDRPVLQTDKDLMEVLQEETQRGIAQYNIKQQERIRDERGNPTQYYLPRNIHARRVQTLSAGGLDAISKNNLRVITFRIT